MTTVHVRADPRAPLDEETLRLVDAYWRAANYLSVGQIYLLANPLLREPLLPEHVKPRLLGHFGTTPGLNLVYVHLNRAIRERNLERDLRHRAGARRPQPGGECVPRGHVLGALLGRRTRRGGAAEVVPPVLVSGRHPEPRRARGAGLDSRRRGARLCAGSRFRSRVRQPRPARGLRRRRRRGGDGAARGELALEQVPQPREGRSRAPDPPPERLQDREPDRARSHSGSGAPLAVRGLRVSPATRSRATSRRRCTRRLPPRSTTRSTRSPRFSVPPARTV